MKVDVNHVLRVYIIFVLMDDGTLERKSLLIMQLCVFYEVSPS